MSVQWALWPMLAPTITVLLVIDAALVLAVLWLVVALVRRLFR